MPNWCDNELSIYGPEKDIKRFVKQARGHDWSWDPLFSPGDGDMKCLEFNQFIPMPADIINNGYNGGGYDWENTNWGVKWGACDPSVSPIAKCRSKSMKNKATVSYTFTTPWGPAETALQKIGLLYPTLTFICEFEEPGMGFAGRIEVKGESVSRDDWDYVEKEEDK
jgi:hypothetical protein